MSDDALARDMLERGNVRELSALIFERNTMRAMLSIALEKALQSPTHTVEITAELIGVALRKVPP